MVGWFSPRTPASSTTKTVRHDIAEILLKVALNTKNQIKSLHIDIIISTTFTLLLHYIYITFTLHLHYIYIAFTLHLHCIYITFTLHLCHYLHCIYIIIDIYTSVVFTHTLNLALLQVTVQHQCSSAITENAYYNKGNLMVYLIAMTTVTKKIVLWV